MNLGTFTPAEKVIKAKIKLNDTHPFFAFILMNMIISEDKKQKMKVSIEDKKTGKITETEMMIGQLPCPTMGVDRRGHLIYDPEFVESLSFEELCGVLAHEAMHIATLTFKRQGWRNMQLWNYATDYVINYILQLENLTLPKGGLLPDRQGNIEIKTQDGKIHKFCMADKNAEEVYDWLDKIVDKLDKSGKWGDGGSGMGSKQFDNHSNKGNEKGEGEGDSEGDGNAGMSESECAEADADWKQKAADAATSAKQRSKLSSNMERVVGQVLEPVVDWRRKLYNAITNELPHNFTMRTPGRRYNSTGIYTPKVLKENLKIEVGIDVSGSISDKELTDFASEVLSIANGFAQTEVRVFWWSTAIKDSDELVLHRGSTPKDFLKHKFNSTGGTTMSCIYDYFKRTNKSPRICVILTDGFVEPNPKLPEGIKYIFCISKGGIADHVKDLGEVCMLNRTAD